MKKYFFALDEMTLEEIEIIRLLTRYSNYETNITGYTVNQLVIGADNRLNLTTQKVRTILKKFEKLGYIELLSSGSKGKESTLKLTIKQQLFNNNTTDKVEQLQGVDDINNNNLTTNQQQSNNTTKNKDKKNNNIIDTYTENNDLKEAINDFISMRSKIKKPVTDRALKGILNKLNNFTDDDTEKILILEQSIENCWAGVFELKNKKGPIAVGPKKNKNINVNPSICNPRRKYTQACDIG